MTDQGAAERVLERLAAVKWDDDDGAYRHQRSRSRLSYEFLRRSAQWAQAVGALQGWPFNDLPAAIDPSIRADQALVDTFIAGAGLDPAWASVQRASGAALHWAALGELPRQRFPELDDPYEPFLLLLERGGGFMVGNGFIELGYGSVPIKSSGERAASEPLPIDEATLHALDEES